MEAYFHNDSRIEEWVDQITEKIFTVCLLSGVDSEAEFQRGCQIVAKLTSLLMGFSTFPPEYLEDGLRQLLEQQLPDGRVINNFPAFQDTMDKMIREGLSKAINTESIEPINSQCLVQEVTQVANSEDNLEVTRELFEIKDCSIEVANEEYVTESVISALASVKIPHFDIQDPTATICKDSAERNYMINDSINVEPKVTLMNTEILEISHTPEVPEQANRLKQVLNTIFPNRSICWNMKLQDQTFLAQVEDILIYVVEPHNPCLTENLLKEGWKVFKCSSEDLLFPRRLERGIRQTQRSGKNSIIV